MTCINGNLVRGKDVYTNPQMDLAHTKHPKIQGLKRETYGAITLPQSSDQRRICVVLRMIKMGKFLISCQRADAQVLNLPPVSVAHPLPVLEVPGVLGCLHLEV